MACCDWLRVEGGPCPGGDVSRGCAVGRLECVAVITGARDQTCCWDEHRTTTRLYYILKFSDQIGDRARLKICSKFELLIDFLQNLEKPPLQPDSTPTHICSKEGHSLTTKIKNLKLNWFIFWIYVLLFCFYVWRLAGPRAWLENQCRNNQWLILGLFLTVNSNFSPPTMGVKFITWSSLIEHFILFIFNQTRSGILLLDCSLCCYPQVSVLCQDWLRVPQLFESWSGRPAVEDVNLRYIERSSTAWRRKL